MPIRFHCEACEARVKVPGGSEGRKVKCPRCGHLQRVPHHAEQPAPVAVGVSAAEEIGDDSGSFEAQTETEHAPDRGRLTVPTAEPSTVSTSTANAPRKGGLDAGDSLGDLARSFEDRRDMTPPDVAARALEKHDQQASPAPAAAAQAPVQPSPRATPAPPRPLPMVSWSGQRRAQAAPQPAEAPAAPLPREPVPYIALRNLATTLRVIPALMIPAVLWHILNATTLSGSIVTFITGGAIVAITWTLAEIADAVRDMAIHHDA